MQFTLITALTIFTTVVAAAPPAAPIPRLECNCVCGTDTALSATVTKQLCEKSIALAGGDPSIMSLSASGACSFNGPILDFQDAFAGILDGMKENCPKTNAACGEIKCDFWSKDGVEEDITTSGEPAGPI